jgi:transmembrane sensor
MASETIREQAIAWAVRTGDPAFEDWEAFTHWLEQDSAHALAYDEAVAAIADAEEALKSAPKADNDTEGRVIGPSRRRWLGGALAACLALIAGLGVWQLRDPSYAVETAPGEMRVIALAGGGEIALGGDSRIVLDRDDARMASLARGQALFTIRHDEKAPFRLTVGEDTLVDVGTIFDVKRTAGSMTVAVAEGAVVFNPDRENVYLSPGKRLTLSAGTRSYRVDDVPLEQIGEWREGRVTFQDATWADVAVDLSRATGIAFVAGPGASGQRVSGSVLTAPVKADPRTLGPLLGVGVRYTGEAWEIGSR